MSSLVSNNINQTMEVVMSQSNGYSGVMTKIGKVERLPKVFVPTPVVTIDHKFSDKNAFTSEKTTIYSSIGLDVKVENVVLYRQKREMRVNLDDPYYNYASSKAGDILNDMSRAWEEVAFRGIVPAWGLYNNPKLTVKTLDDPAVDIVNFTSIIFGEIAQMKAKGYGSSFSILMPIRWFENFSNAGDYLPIEAFEKGVQTSSQWAQITAQTLTSELFDTVYIVANDHFALFVNEVPNLSYDSVIELDYHKWRFQMDTTAVKLRNQGSAVKINNIFKTQYVSEFNVNVQVVK